MVTIAPLLLWRITHHPGLVIFLTMNAARAYDPGAVRWPDGCCLFLLGFFRGDRERKVRAPQDQDAG